jgi:polysaccharide export outer membrane protein
MVQRATLFILLSIVLAGCFRYVVPTSELQKKAAPKGESTFDYLGPEQFTSQENEIRNRLLSLAQERSGLGSASGDNAYRLGARDVLDFTVFGLPELTTVLEVSPEGMLRVPVVPEEIAVSGITIYEARDIIADRLKRFVRNPQVNLSLKSYESQRVAVTGAVAKPGMYPLKRRASTLAEMLAEAGGRTEKAGNRIIVVPAGKGTGPEKAAQKGVEVDYEELLGTGGQPPLSLALVGGDTIIVPEAGTYEVDGEVDTPGSHKITGRTSVLSAIAASGGFTFAAKLDEVEVIRDLGGGKRALLVLNLERQGTSGLQDIRVRDGDLIRVPTASGRHFQRQVVEGINAIFRGVGVQGRMN